MIDVMEKELELRGQRIRFDYDATVALYRDTIHAPGADRCVCTSCKNFAAQRSTVYPTEFHNLSARLGVDSGTEWEAFDYDFSTASGEHLYGGWFLFCGELLAGDGSRPDREGTRFAHWFTRRLPACTTAGDTKVCAIEFLVKILWVLPKEAV
jgi:hypothetical protein